MFKKQKFKSTTFKIKATDRKKLLRKVHFIKKTVGKYEYLKKVRKKHR